MFFGEFQHTIDQKNRVVIPAKFRAFVKNQDDTKGFIIGVSVITNDRCLYMYPYSGMQKVIEDIRKIIGDAENAEHYVRLFATNAEFVEIDAQSRIVIPQKFIETVGLEREVAMIGAIEKIEIWNSAEWRRRRAEQPALKEQMISRAKILRSSGNKERVN